MLFSSLSSFLHFTFSLAGKLIAKSEKRECQRSHCLGLREQLQQNLGKLP